MKNIKFLILFTALISFIDTFSQVTNSSAPMALVGAKIYLSPDRPPIINGVLLIENGKISKVGTANEVTIPPSTKVLPCDGQVIMPGFWNCHVHFMEPKWQQADKLPAKLLKEQLNSMLTQYGFSYAFDLATLDMDNLLHLRNRIEREEVSGPAILIAGVPFAPENGSPFYIAPQKMPELSSVQSVREHVKNQLEQGADGIKLWTASPDGDKIILTPVKIIKQAVKSAHRKNKPVIAHPTNLKGAWLAQQGGVDILAHVAADDRMDLPKSLVKAMIAQKMALIPTLKLYKWDLERTGHSTENNALLNEAIQQLHTYSKAGGQILFGTDVGYMSDYSPEDEYILMEKAGMNYLQILTSLTSAPAWRFGQEKVTGKIAIGMQANLVVLTADPEVDVKNFIKVRYTIRKGKIIYTAK